MWDRGGKTCENCGEDSGYDHLCYKCCNDDNSVDYDDWDNDDSEKLYRCNNCYSILKGVKKACGNCGLSLCGKCREECIDGYCPKCKDLLLIRM